MSLSNYYQLSISNLGDTFIVIVLLWTQQIHPLLYWFCVFFCVFFLSCHCMENISMEMIMLVPNKSLYYIHHMHVRTPHMKCVVDIMNKFTKGTPSMVKTYHSSNLFFSFSFALFLIWFFSSQLHDLAKPFFWQYLVINLILNFFNSQRIAHQTPFFQCTMMYDAYTCIYTL